MAPKSEFRFLRQAAKLATQGVIEDNNGNIQEAMRLYEESEIYFLHAIKYEAPDDELKAAIGKRCKEFQDRVKELKSSSTA